jgi:hypothetical protein
MWDTFLMKLQIGRVFITKAWKERMRNGGDKNR